MGVQTKHEKCPSPGCISDASRIRPRIFADGNYYCSKRCFLNRTKPKRGALHIQRTPDPAPEPGSKVTVPVRFVCSAGFAGDWAMYMGWAHWNDQEIANGGDKVSEETARRIVIDASMALDSLRGFLDLAYRP